MRDTFSDCHPAVNFLYYALVLVLSMSLMQPVCLAISLLCASWYLLRLQGWDALWQKLRWLLPVMALAAVMNPAFTHQGMTILTYLPSGNPLTLESILYGLAAAGLLASVILWFSSFSEVMTSDKFIYLFGRVAPALSLVLSMTLRFVPLLRRQMHKVSAAQKAMGLYSGSGIVAKAQSAMRVFTAMIAWSFENAMDTAASMKARGYGRKGRTQFSLFRFRASDAALLTVCAALLGTVAAGAAVGAVTFYFYPRITPLPAAPGAVTVYAAFGMLSALPFILEVKEALVWRFCVSKI